MCNFKKWIVTPTENKDPRTGEVKSQTYNAKDDMQMPINLYVNTNEQQNKLTIEFTSRILFDDCYLLINKYTIRQCLESINKLGICELDIEGILAEAAVTNIDFTVDIAFHFTEQLYNEMSALSGDYKRYKKRHYEREGITFSRAVKEPRCKEALKIYDKEKEFNDKKNYAFLQRLNNPQALWRHFQGKIRIEASFPTAKKIREVLQIEQTYLMDVLECQFNPLAYIFNRVFPQSNVALEVENYKDWEVLCALKLYNYDLEAIEQQLKVCKTNDRTRQRLMSRYREVSQRRKSVSNPYGLINQLRSRIADL